MINRVFSPQRLGSGAAVFGGQLPMGLFNFGTGAAPIARTCHVHAERRTVTVGREPRILRVARERLVVAD